MRPLGGIAALVVLGAAAGVLVFGSRSTSSATHAVSAGSAFGQVTSAQVDDGQRLYVNSCASCHGTAGEGTAVGPDIRSVGAAGIDFVLRTGRMPLGDPDAPDWDQQPQFTEEQIAALVAYTSAFVSGPEIPDVVADPADLHRGWELYVNNCAACHGATGGGGAIGGGFVAPGLGRSDPLIVAEAVTVGPGVMPHFRFNQADLNALAGYVQHLRNQPSPGGLPIAGAGPVPEGLIAALIGVAGMVLLVKWIARRAEFEPRDER